MSVASPCTGVCKLDESTGWCLGCGRTGYEIAEWRAYPELRREGIWDQIPDRLTQLGVSCRRLPWTTDQIRDLVVRSLKEGRAKCVIGVVGATAEFSLPTEAEIDVAVEDDGVVARTRMGAISMRINDHVRALTFDPPGLEVERRIVLAVKREAGRLPVSKGLADLGDDDSALLDDAGTRLFDLALGRKEGRFCVRVEDGAARDALEKANGLAFADSLPKIGPALLAESPTRVVDSALGRIEVQGQIPLPGARSPDGPHTHLLPDHLATGRALPVGMDLPRAYLPGAIVFLKG
ncbi:MAG: DUF1289 domain-containing protein [Pseudomonadota bacterium]